MKKLQSKIDLLSFFRLIDQNSNQTQSVALRCSAYRQSEFLYTNLVCTLSIYSDRFTTKPSEIFCFAARRRFMNESRRTNGYEKANNFILRHFDHASQQEVSFLKSGFGEKKDAYSQSKKTLQKRNAYSKGYFRQTKEGRCIDLFLDYTLHCNAPRKKRRS